MDQKPRKNQTFVTVIPSGELTVCYGKSPFLMGKSTISIAIFHSFLYVHQRVINLAGFYLRYNEVWEIQGWQVSSACGAIRSRFAGFPYGYPKPLVFPVPEDPWCWNIYLH
jgi:hypothetical protein